MFIKNRDQKGGVSNRLLAVIVAVLIVVGVIVVVNHKDNSSSPSNNSSSSSSVVATKAATVDGFKFNYPSNWTETPLSDKDKQTGNLLKLADPAHNGTFVWYAIKGKLSDSINLNKVANQVANNLKTGAKQYKLISQKIEKLNGRQTIVIQYQQSIEGQTYQTILRIVPRAKQTDYLTLKARSDQFSQLMAGLPTILDSYNNYATQQEQQ